MMVSMEKEAIMQRWEFWLTLFELLVRILEWVLNYLALWLMLTSAG